MFGEYNHYIVWMPTFRVTKKFQDGIDSELGLSFVTVDNISRLNDCLRDRNILLILKLHPWSAQKVDSISYSNIVNLHQSEIPVNITLYQLLSETDALITDYSSVYIDYTLIDKPIAFVYDDIDEYRRTRGFSFEPVEQYMPGEHIRDFNSLLEWVEHFEDDKFKEMRRELANMFHVYHDANSTERVLKEINIIE